MDPSFKEKKTQKKREKEEEKTADPSFHNSTAEGLEFGSEEEKGGRAEGKHDPEEHRRVGGGSPPAAATGLI